MCNLSISRYHSPQIKAARQGVLILTRRIARAVRDLQFLLGNGLIFAVLNIGVLRAERPRSRSLRRTFAQHKNLPLARAQHAVRQVYRYSIPQGGARGIIGGQTRKAAPARGAW